MKLKDLKDHWVRSFSSPLAFLKSVHFKKTMYISPFSIISWICFDVSWCFIENGHSFEWNEDHITVFLKWTDFSTYTILKECLIKQWHYILYIIAINVRPQQTTHKFWNINKISSVQSTLFNQSIVYNFQRPHLG